MFAELLVGQMSKGSMFAELKAWLNGETVKTTLPAPVPEIFQAKSHGQPRTAGHAQRKQKRKAAERARRRNRK